MSQIFGAIRFGSEEPPSGWAHAMREAMRTWPHDREGSASIPGGFLGSFHRYNTPQCEAAHQPVQTPGLSLVFDGRLDNREELARLVGEPLRESTTDESLILGSFSRMRTLAFERWVGDFAVALWDKTHRKLYLVKDPMGVRPLYTAIHPERIAFASSLHGLLALPWVDASINEPWVADFFSGTLAEFGPTFYRGIRILEPGHALEVDAAGCRQWRVQGLDPDKEISGFGDDEYVEAFRGHLFEAVRCRMRTLGPLACELSGGLDSTTVTTVADRLLPSGRGKILAFSHMLHSEYQGRVYPFEDEARWIRMVLDKTRNVEHFPIYNRGKGILDLIESSLEIHCGPNLFDLGSQLSEAAPLMRERGVRSILSGFGGDQLASSPGAGWEEEMAARGNWRELWRSDARMGRNPILHSLRILRKVISHARPRQFPAWESRLAFIPIQPVFAETYGYPARYHDFPIRPRTGTVRQREFRVIQSPEVYLRTNNSCQSASSLGIEYRYPLLDMRLLQFCLSLPATQKRRGGVRRRMIRLATHDLLPEELRRRDDKSGATVPTIIHRLLQDRDCLRGLVRRFQQSGDLNRYVRVEDMLRFVEGLRGEYKMDMHVASSIQAFCLGLWLERQKRNPEYAIGIR